MWWFWPPRTGSRRKYNLSLSLYVWWRLIKNGCFKSFITWTFILAYSVKSQKLSYWHCTCVLVVRCLETHGVGGHAVIGFRRYILLAHDLRVLVRLNKHGLGNGFEGVGLASRTGFVLNQLHVPERSLAYEVWSVQRRVNDFRPPSRYVLSLWNSFAGLQTSSHQGFPELGDFRREYRLNCSRY